jgi:hypothetical protein
MKGTDTWLDSHFNRLRIVETNNPEVLWAEA